MHAASPSSHPGLSITLKHRRRLGYVEYGDPHGKAVLYFPGTPRSRLLHPPLDVTASLGMRLLALERPGYGISDFQSARRLLDWPGDASASADVLG